MNPQGAQYHQTESHRQTGSHQQIGPDQLTRLHDRRQSSHEARFNPYKHGQHQQTTSYNHQPSNHYQTVMQCQQTVTNCPQTVIQCPQTVTQCQQTVTNCSQTVMQCPQTVMQCQQTVTNCPKTVTQFPQIGSSSPPVKYDAADLLIAKLYMMIVKCAQPVLLKVFQAEFKPLSSNQSFCTYLNTQKGFSLRYLKSKVHRDFMKTIEDDFTGKKYDVSLLYVAITLLRSHKKSNSITCKVDIVEPNDNLHTYLTEVKIFRNKLIHLQRTSTMTNFNNEFMNITETLRNLLWKVLESMKHIYKINDSEINKEIQCMNDNINSIRDSSLKPFDEQQYQDMLLLDALSYSVINIGVPELKNIYKKWSYISPLSFIDGFHSFLEVGVVFTKLKIQKFVKNSMTKEKKNTVTDEEKKNTNEEKKNNDIDYTQIFDLLQEMPSHQSNSNMEIILIEGPAGCGKTTLTKMLLHNWVEENDTINGLKDFNLLIYMECRNSRIKTLSQLLKSLMPETAKKFVEDDLITCITINDFKLLLVVDGLDELNNSSIETLKEILNLDELNNSSIETLKEILNLPESCSVTILCTSRAERTIDFYKLIPSNSKSVHLKVLGIAHNLRIAFAKKYHDELIRTSQSTQRTEGLIEYLEQKSSRLQDHLHLPLNMVMIIFLWALAPDMVNSVTSASELYIQILHLCVKKLIQRLVNKDILLMTTVEQIKDKIKEFLLTLFYESLKSLKENNIILTREVTKKLHDKCDQIGLPSDELIGAFLVKKTIWTDVITGIEISVSFPHKSLQEFYSAYHLFLLIRNSQQKIDTNSFLKDIQTVMENHGFTPITSNTFKSLTLDYLKSIASTDSTLMLSEIIENECLRSVQVRPSRDQLNQGIHVGLQMPQFSSSQVGLVRSSFSSGHVGLERPSFSSRHQMATSAIDEDLTITLTKFHNVFVHLVGFMYGDGVNMDKKSINQIDCVNLDELKHTDDVNVDKETVNQMVQLLIKAGLKTNDQWMDILSDAKFDKNMAYYIIEHIPHLIQGYLTITDGTVAAYATLLSSSYPNPQYNHQPYNSLETYNSTVPYNSPVTLVKPDIVDVIISGSQLPPTLLCLLDVLTTLNTTKIMIQFHHQYRHSNTLDKNFDDKLQLLFEKCNVVLFEGHISGDAVKKLCHSIKYLSLIISDNTPKLNDALNSLTYCSQLKILHIHVPAGTALDILPSIPNIRIKLWLSGVTSQHLDWVKNALQRLVPSERKLYSLLFPLSDLSNNDIANLLERMRNAGVKLNDDGVVYISGDQFHSNHQFGYSLIKSPHLKKEDWDECFIDN